MVKAINYRNLFYGLVILMISLSSITVGLANSNRNLMTDLGTNKTDSRYTKICNYLGCDGAGTQLCAIYSFPSQNGELSKRYPCYNIRTPW